MTKLQARQVTPDIWMLEFTVGQAYAVRLPDGWAMVDTGLGGPGQAEAALDALAALPGPGELREIVLTHYHLDHRGNAAALAEATGARVLAGAGDAAVIRGEAEEPPPVLEEWEVPVFGSVQAVIADAGTPPPAPCRVDRELADGDALDWGQDVRIVGVPGHTAGSIALHLTGSRALFTGDTIARHLEVMLGPFNIDRPQAVASFRRQAALDVDVACFGHGAPLVGGAGKTLREAAERLGG
ncbi:MBL fold metallo-hydrolase [Streptomyces sp. AV19]|uniref:MBL fold metallo-hydrolase n=1 Tax=Streptomyces sp. AV19 TaxID=2793068 RepID=UPI0018FE7F74|nr:MBL fold metallo-hydrolase [Streptomyces sp. AV19]MBH1938849.1 MBL fold metallo-hydrolase [Streptomyces sp. AV19]MDG4533532.1 MBL fold metallo-hydrolase [Streptomyces sp. AV19]